jgi:hypothetical protein
MGVTPMVALSLIEEPEANLVRSSAYSGAMVPFIRDSFDEPVMPRNTAE